MLQPGDWVHVRNFLERGETSEVRAPWELLVNNIKEGTGGNPVIYKLITEDYPERKVNVISYAITY